MAKQTITYDPQILDLILYAGDGTEFRLVVTDAAAAPVPLTGTMIAQIRNQRDDVTVVTAFDIDLAEADDGIAVVSLTGDQTQDLVTNGAKFSGVWDLQWTPTAEEPRTLCQGKVECAPDVSR